MPPECQEFVHTALNRPVTAIGGHYVFTKEARLDVEGRPLLYRIGYAVLDSACCGAGGVSYALMAGFILHEKVRRNRQGDLISEVEPISDPHLQQRVRKRIMDQDAVSQVIFG